MPSKQSRRQYFLFFLDAFRNVQNAFYSKLHWHLRKTCRDVITCPAFRFAQICISHCKRMLSYHLNSTHRSVQFCRVFIFRIRIVFLIPKTLCEDFSRISVLGFLWEDLNGCLYVCNCVCHYLCMSVCARTYVHVCHS